MKVFHSLNQKDIVCLYLYLYMVLQQILPITEQNLHCTGDLFKLQLTKNYHLNSAHSRLLLVCLEFQSIPLRLSLLQDSLKQVNTQIIGTVK